MSESDVEWLRDEIKTRFGNVEITPRIDYERLSKMTDTIERLEAENAELAQNLENGDAEIDRLDNELDRLEADNRRYFEDFRTQQDEIVRSHAINERYRAALEGLEKRLREHHLTAIEQIHWASVAHKALAHETTS